MKKIVLSEAFNTIREPWKPVVAGTVGQSSVKLAVFAGAFDWHHHEHEDELFLVVRGRLKIRLRTGDIDLEKGEFLIVPRGVEHCPVALTPECEVLLVEPATTLNTGNLVNARTVHHLDELKG